MPKRLVSALLLALILSTQVMTYGADYTQSTLLLTIYVDGVVSVDYDVDVDPTLARVRIPLFGSHFTDLTVVNNDGLILDYTLEAGVLVVDSLGSSGVSVSYSTPDLTGKVGPLWTLSVVTPSTAGILLPEGSTVVGLSSVPLQMTTVNGKPYLSIQAGALEVDYLVGPFDSREKALAFINAAETAIANAKAVNVIVTSAEQLVAQAKAALAGGDNARAELFAAQASNTVSSTLSDAASAASAIARATDAIAKARSEGRTSGLSTAEASLSAATNLNKTGAYALAAQTANRAFDEAAAAKSDLNPIILGGVVVLVIGAVAALLYSRRRKPVEPKPEPAVAPKKPEPGPVDVEKILLKYPDLRVDDKEVIRFLAEREGEAFANDIRDRFEIPRTSAWRMIQRLTSLGVVEEHKVGSQSLIRIPDKYRRPQQ